MSETIGEILAAARRKQGKSLSEAEAATRIRSRRLEAIEKSDWDGLPDPAYVKGYIIGYAKFLGLDPQPLVTRYLAETGARRRSSDFSRLPEQVVAPRHQAHAIPWKGAAAVAAVVALATIAIWGGMRVFSKPDETPVLPTVPETTSTAGGAAAPGVTATQTIPGAAQTTSIPTGDPFVLRVEIAQAGASWLRVTVDGLKAYEGTLAGGQTKEWEVTESATIRVGKRDNVTVLKDGTPVALPGGDVPEVTIRAAE